MPELPEVECLTNAVAKTITGYVGDSIEFYRSAIREEIPQDLVKKVLVGNPVLRVFRRSKYLLIETAKGHAVVHLGMTGNLLASTEKEPQVAHTHVVFAFKKGKVRLFLHYVDPRRFGRISAFKNSDYMNHEWFRDLGPEPLETANLGKVLYERSRKKNTPVKSFLMDPEVVVGVGNIYACESLFLAGVNPLLKARDVGLPEYKLIAQAVQKTLKKAIKAGGTTFRDFRNSDGSSGYFAVSLQVYNRAKKPCSKCANPIKVERISGRSTFFCPFCQK